MGRHHQALGLIVREGFVLERTHVSSVSEARGPATVGQNCANVQPFIRPRPRTARPASGSAARPGAGCTRPGGAGDVLTRDGVLEVEAAVKNFDDEFG